MSKIFLLLIFTLTSAYAIENLTYFGKLIKQDNGTVYFELSDKGRISGKTNCFKFDEGKINTNQFIEIDNSCINEIVYSKEKK